MLSQLGHSLLLLTLLACVCNIGANVAALRAGEVARREAWLEAAHNAVFVTFAFVLGACILLSSAFLSDNFSLAYVYQNSSRSQPLPFKISALWGGQGGSLLLWTLVLASYALIVSRGGRKSGQILAPIAAAVISATTLFFAGLIAFAANPFTLNEVVPQDGMGMNPLLQNYWMQIHPPTLYFGYVGCTVPFAFAVAALVHRKFDGDWVAAIRKWVLFTWIFLTVGIVLGGVWAYETLGWGGYWAWDPVENASLMPWLTATAFLHSIMLQARRGLLKNWNIALVTLTFLLSIFGTFLTRSGVVQSVHSFAESGIGGYFLGFLGATLVLTLVLIYWRREELYSDAKVESSFSREGAFMLNNWLFLGCTFAVLWGTVFPTLSEALGNGRVAVEQSYFNRTLAPLSIGLLALTGVGPLLPWRKATLATLWRALKFPLLWSIAFSPLFALFVWVLNQNRPDRFWNQTGGIVALFLAFFVFYAIGSEFWKGARALMQKRGESAFDATANLLTFNPARYGGYIVHLGVALMAFGLAGSALFKIELDPVDLKAGETMKIGEYTLKFEGLARPHEFPRGLKDQMFARVSVWDASGQITPEKSPLAPSIDFFDDNPEALANRGEESLRARRPSIRMTPANDLYLVLDGFDTKDNSATIKAYLNPLVMWMWLSVGFFVGGTLVAMMPTRKDRLGAVEKPNAPKREERELIAR